MRTRQHFLCVWVGNRAFMLITLPDQKHQQPKKALPTGENTWRKIESAHGRDLAWPHCPSSENEKAASIFPLIKLVTL